MKGTNTTISVRAPAVCGLAAVAALLLGASGASAQGVGTSPGITGFVQAGLNGAIVEAPYGTLPIVPNSSAVDYTFQLVQARLYFRGSVDDRIGYAIQGNFAGGFSLLTAYMTYRLNDSVTLYGGQMLKPFGQDRTRPRHLLRSLDRTYSSLLLVNGLLYGNWDTGAMAHIVLERGGTLSLGLFNGRGPGSTRDNDNGKNAVGRIVLPVGPLTVGGSVSFQHISTIPKNGRDNLAWGVDLLLEREAFSLEGEVISASDWLFYDPISGETPTALGAALTGAFPIGPLFGARATEVVVRLERLDPDGDLIDDEFLLVVPNLNIAFSDAARLQVGAVYESPAASGKKAALTGVLLWQVNFF